MLPVVRLNCRTRLTCWAAKAGPAPTEGEEGRGVLRQALFSTPTHRITLLHNLKAIRRFILSLLHVGLMLFVR